ncbi:lecithin-cholesterol acyltransferase-like 1 [Impatiens glandulifera]|uniref:lecithin-cholesterol acyltransferase-like 1 n=1 Tax=Impatiens glandulifera TaxID=253017 RepID=UPI001FB113F2|nr:lecithin-cholesterol acyltransferase-like 1 [Impatiens glandulifera]
MRQGFIEPNNNILAVSATATAMIVLAVAMTAFACQAAATGVNLHPIILVPGNGGNQLEGRLTDEYKPPTTFCALNGWNKHHWFNLWFDPTVVVAPYTQCFSDRMTLVYDQDLDDYRNMQGVETRVLDFGSTSSLLYLNPYFKHLTSYMAPLVKSLEEIGYVDGKTIFGAPYDFRYGLAPEGHPNSVGSKFLDDLKQLIEDAYSSNGGKPVILISHSLGALFVHQLLIRSSLSWRRNHVKHFIALSPPWGGTTVEMLTFASGYTLDVPLVQPLLVRGEQRSSESNMWLMPNPRIFGRNKTLVITPKSSFTAFDIERFLVDIGYLEGVRPYKTRILPLVERLKAPQIPVTSVIGYGVNTPETLFYGDDGYDKQPDIIYGDGDGTVNLVSLLAAESEWREERNQSHKVIKLSGLSHTDVLSAKIALSEIVEEICVINGNKNSLNSYYK